MRAVMRLISTFSQNSEFANYVFRMICKGADIWECVRTASKVRSEEDWFSAWHEAAQKWEGRAEEFLAKGCHISARDAFRHASFFYRAAEFFLLEADPRKVPTFMKNVECFEKAGRFLNPPLKSVEIPYEETTLPGYLYLPREQRGAVPGVVFQGGRDDCKEEHLFAGPLDMVERGLACLTFDGPGKGETLYVKKLYSRPDYERVISAVINFLSAQPEINRERIGLVGISVGSYYAARGAAYDPRVRASVFFAPLYDMGVSLFDFVSSSRETLRFILGARDLKEARKRLEEFTLKDCISKITCPVLLMNGAKDPLRPASEAPRVYDQLRCPKELRMWEDGLHNCQDYQSEAFPYAWDWLAEKLT